MKKIKITSKKFPNIFAIVDDEDYGDLVGFKWHLIVTKNTTYAARSKWDGSRVRKILMHRQIMNTLPGMHVDHINHNGLDNHKSNLRNCTVSQNLTNQGPRKQTSSKYKGVCWHAARNKWLSFISVGGVQTHLGLFNTEIEAASEYNLAVRKYRDKYAYLNPL